MAVEAAAGEVGGRVPLVPVSVRERRLDSNMKVFCHGSPRQNHFKLHSFTIDSDILHLGRTPEQGQGERYFQRRAQHRTRRRIPLHSHFGGGAPRSLNQGTHHQPIQRERVVLRP
jgi:hypothetical protein